MEIKNTFSSLERQEALAKFLEQRQRASVIEIAELFYVSEATVRRDLERLAKKGKVQRFHGGAKIASQIPIELPILRRATDQKKEKKRIAQAAAGMVNDGETVFLGSGTTVLEVAYHLYHFRKLTVITNSLQIINTLIHAPNITIIALGGIMHRSEMSMIGHITEQALTQVRAHKFIMGVRSLDVEHGLTSDYLPEAMTDRAILARGSEVIILADHSKFERVSSVHIAAPAIAYVIVTDVDAPQSCVEKLKEMGIKVLQV